MFDLKHFKTTSLNIMPTKVSFVQKTLVFFVPVFFFFLKGKANSSVENK